MLPLPSNLLQKRTSYLHLLNSNTTTPSSSYQTITEKRSSRTKKFLFPDGNLTESFYENVKDVAQPRIICQNSQESSALRAIHVFV